VERAPSGAATIGARKRSREAMESRSRSVVFAAMARVAAACITGPSAIGSENGRPSSITSAPAASMASSKAAVSPSPPIA